jgi:CheY-like chemotaxis protein
VSGPGINDQVIDFTDADCATSKLTILVVDDEGDIRLLVRTVLERAGIEVVGEAVDGLDAIAKFRELDAPPIPSVILLDNRMPGLGGLDVASEILARLPHQVIILFSAFLDKEIEDDASRLGVAACVSKKDVLRLPEIIRTLVASRI